MSLKELAKQRLDQRFDERNTNFQDYVKVRSSCYIVEQKGSEFYCDCFEGSKGRVCKHTVGLMYKCGLLEVTSDVRSKPLGQKRKRGRPAKLPHCLARSPIKEQEVLEEIPMAEYHELSFTDLEIEDIENIEIVVQSSPVIVLPKKTKKRKLVSIHL